MLILLIYDVTDVGVRLVCMHVIYLPVPTSFAAAVVVSLFPPPPVAHLKQVLEIKKNIFSLIDDAVLTGYKLSHSAQARMKVFEGGQAILQELKAKISALAPDCMHHKHVLDLLCSKPTHIKGSSSPYQNTL